MRAQTRLESLIESACKTAEYVEITRARIKHHGLEGDYTRAPDVPATWYIDPPYNNRAGSYYIHSTLDYIALGLWCRERRGQVIVCENAGATWLPFRPLGVFQQNNMSGKASREVIWP